MINWGTKWLGLPPSVGFEGPSIELLATGGGGVKANTTGLAIIEKGSELSTAGRLVKLLDAEETEFFEVDFITVRGTGLVATVLFDVDIAGGVATAAAAL
jgi:hypothetical protein